MAPKRATLRVSAPEPNKRGKKRPEGMSDKAWEEEVQRLAYANGDRRARAKKAKLFVQEQ